jgi:hypothetical protein
MTLFVLDEKNMMAEVAWEGFRISKAGSQASGQA